MFSDPITRSLEDEQVTKCEILTRSEQGLSELPSEPESPPSSVEGEKNPLDVWIAESEEKKLFIELYLKQAGVEPDLANRWIEEPLFVRILERCVVAYYAFTEYRRSDISYSKISFTLITSHYGETVTAVLAVLMGHNVSVSAEEPKPPAIAASVVAPGVGKGKKSRVGACVEPAKTPVKTSAQIALEKLLDFIRGVYVDDEYRTPIASGETLSSCSCTEISPFLFNPNLPARLIALQALLDRETTISNSDAAKPATLTFQEVTIPISPAMAVRVVGAGLVANVIRVGFYCRVSPNTSDDASRVRALDSTFMINVINYIAQVVPPAKIIEIVLFGDPGDPRVNMEVLRSRRLTVHDLRGMHMRPSGAGETIIARDIQVACIRHLVKLYEPTLLYGPRSGLTLLYTALSRPGIMVELPPTVVGGPSRRRIEVAAVTGRLRVLPTPGTALVPFFTGKAERRQTAAFLHCPVGGQGPLVPSPTFPISLDKSLEPGNAGFELATLAYLCREDRLAGLSMVMLSRYLHWGHNPIMHSTMSEFRMLFLGILRGRPSAPEAYFAPPDVSLS
ncbi:MAG: hypothetical protein KBD64_04335 [Gammaproteobacteria bacterium]|nr:hypothetical protein [Gammaproteobacteria bacterium]